MIIIILLKTYSSEKASKLNRINSNITIELDLNTSDISNISNISNILTKDNSTEMIEKEENKIREIEIQKGLNFLDKCKKGSLNSNEKFIKSEEPKITVVLPVYNCEDTIKRAIRSIQYQNMKEIEIIIVNDFSREILKKIIEEMAKEDQRIIIMNNDKNMGMLYSRSIGVLESKGKYILSLDCDDMFLEDNVFNIIYEEAEKNKYDIISFKVFDYLTSNNIKDDYFTDKINNSIIIQPELSNTNNISPNNIVIWGKLIKSEVYKKAVYSLGKAIYTNYVNWDEDVCINFVICQFAQSYKFVEKYGLFHFIYTGGSSSREKDKSKMFSEIFLLDIIFDFSINKTKNMTLQKLMEMKRYKFFNLSDEKNKAYFISVVKKILNSKYIDKKDKEDIRKIYEDILILNQ